ncbi:MAG: DUF1345 domain-containing protein [Mycobacteriales bacterium]
MSVKIAGDRTVQAVGLKLGIIVAVGIATGALAGLLISPKVAALIGWDTVAILYVAVTWLQLRRYPPDLVRKYALREDPSRWVTDIILLAASVASVAAVGVLLVLAKSSSGGTEAALAGLGVTSVIASWLVVHTVFTLHYAELYYAKPEGGVDFGDTKEPAYIDFAYLAFTIGMTFQVSDTGLKVSQFRSVALRHAMLAYLLGTVIIATTINLVAGLGK